MGYEKNVFDSLASNNERLIGEMNAFLASISTSGEETHSPGDETNCSCETKKMDNFSSSDDSNSLPSKLKIPSISSTSVKEGSSGDTRSTSKNLLPIDENGGEATASGGYHDPEYYSNFRHQQQELHSLMEQHLKVGTSGSNYDDDSLVAMAKRMDAATIISDPSFICGPKEKVLTEKITAGMKKLGKSKRKKVKKGRRKREKQREKDNSIDEDSMKGMGMNTRIHDKTKVAEKVPNEPNPMIAKQQMKQSPCLDKDELPFTGRPPSPFTPGSVYDDIIYDSDDQTEIFYVSATDDDNEDVDSNYDSDEDTQVFYESTDDEFDSDDDELVAVGTSVADAVQDLNNKRAVTKVKNLFGLRG